MANEKKPQQSEFPHMEKQVLPEPMEEFISDKATPSKSMQREHQEASAKSEKSEAQKSERGDASSSPQRVQDLKSAGHQENKPENFEPGVEG